MMVPGRAFVMRRSAGNLHCANLPLIHELLDGTVDSCDSKTGKFFASLLPNFSRRQRTLGVLKHSAQNKLLLCEVNH